MRNKLTNERVDNIIKSRRMLRVTNVTTFHTVSVWKCEVCMHVWSATPNNVLNRRTGCPNCKRFRHLTRAQDNILTTTEFIRRAQLVHGDFYSYDHVTYVKSDVSVRIECNIHGMYTQVPNTHLAGSGCPSCSKQRVQQHNVLLKTKAANEFIDKANKIHLGKYLYPNLQYVNNRTKIQIWCDIHGTFEQTPSKHLDGVGCKFCGRLRLKGHYTNTFFEKYPEERNIPARLYMLMMTDIDHTPFVKIGITKQQKSFVRFQTLKSALPTTLLLTYDNVSLYDAFCVEQHLLSRFQDQKHKPSIKFGGYTECLTYTKELLATYIQTFEELINEQTAHTHE